MKIQYTTRDVRTWMKVHFGLLSKTGLMAQDYPAITEIYILREFPFSKAGMTISKRSISLGDDAVQKICKLYSTLKIKQNIT